MPLLKQKHKKDTKTCIPEIKVAVLWSIGLAILRNQPWPQAWKSVRKLIVLRGPDIIISKTVIEKTERESIIGPPNHPWIYLKITEALLFGNRNHYVGLNENNKPSNPAITIVCNQKAQELILIAIW